MIFLIFTIILVVLFVSLPFWAFGKDSKFHAGAVSWQGIAAMLIALVAGYWYLVERRGTAHANVELGAIGVRLDPATALIQARVAVENSGQILLVPQVLDMRLLSVVPYAGPPLAELAADAAAHPSAWPEQVANAPAYAGSELRWSGLRQFRVPAAQEIEPGERDVRIVDMIVPCTIRTAQLTVQLRKPSPSWWQWWLSEPEGGWWWNNRLLIGLDRLCEGEVGAVRTLGPEPVDAGGGHGGQPPRRPRQS